MANIKANKSYKIGQVIYVVLNKEGKIYPMQVIQIITKQSLKGSETNYMLRGNPSMTETVMLSEIAGEVFDTDSEARKMLSSRAVAQINKLVDLAVRKAGEWYPDSVLSQAPDALSVSTADLTTSDDEEDESVALVDMGDGTKAKIKLPTNLAS